MSFKEHTPSGLSFCGVKEGTDMKVLLNGPKDEATLKAYIATRIPGFKKTKEYTCWFASNEREPYYKTKNGHIVIGGFNGAGFKFTPLHGV